MLYIWYIHVCINWHKTLYIFHAWHRLSANINSPTDTSRREEEKRREQKNEEKKEVKKYVLTVVLIVRELYPCVVYVWVSFVCPTTHALIARKGCRYPQLGFCQGVKEWEYCSACCLFILQLMCWFLRYVCCRYPELGDYLQLCSCYTDCRNDR